MPPTAEKELKKEQEIPLFEYNYVVNELIKQAKKQKEDLDYQIMMGQNQLVNIKQDIIKRQSEYSQWEMAEKQKFNNDMSKRTNKILEIENRLNNEVKNFEQRSLDLKVKEDRTEKAQEQYRKLSEDRVEVEKLRVQAQELLSSAERKMSESNSIIATANERMDGCFKLEEKYKLLNQELSNREQKIESDSKSLDAKIKNLEELRLYVDPRIKELKEIEDNTKKLNNDLDNKISELKAREEEDKIIRKSNEDKSSNLERREKDLASKQEEFNRKVQLSESKK